MSAIITILIIIGVIIFFIFYIRRAKKFKFDSVVMINGGVGSGKSSLSVSLSKRAINKAHNIWWRRLHIWRYIPIINYLMRIDKNEEEPKLYSNIPIYKDINKGILFRHYVPFTTNHLLRVFRMNRKSVVLIDEASLLANSTSGIVSKTNPNAKFINQQLTLFLKLIRHELHGNYRNLFGGYANVYYNSQSRNDLHFAFDRVVNQSLYITKSISLPFFKIVWCRDLLLMDSVVNNYDDDYKEDKSNRWFLLSKKVYKSYNSYAYSFLSDDLDSYVPPIFVYKNRFEIATLVDFDEILSSNRILESLYEDYKKESEVVESGQ